MVRNENEYQEALRRIEQDREVRQRQRNALEAEGFTSEQVERGMAPLISFHLQLQEEVDWYEKVRRGNIDPLLNFTGIGPLLIGLRIAAGLTQRQLAERLGSNEAQVSRDERNEYHGITVERAQRILDAMGARVESRVTEMRTGETRRILAESQELVEA